MALLIFKGLRPDLSDVQAPQLLKDLIKRCWDAEILLRPTATELSETLQSWENEMHEGENKKTLFYHQYQKIFNYEVKRTVEIGEEIAASKKVKKGWLTTVENGQVIVEVPVGEVSKIIPLYHPKFHPQSKFISKPLDFKNLPESQNSQEINDEFYGGSKNLELDLNDFNLDELTIQEDPQEQSSHQAQIQIPPKQ